MKFLHLRYLCLLLALGAAHAQDATVPTTAAAGGGTNSVSLPADTAFQVVDLGANHRTWQRQTYEQGANGKVITHFHKYTELATGMNYRDAQGKWVESQELIEPFQNGAVARHGGHQVIFASDLNSQGSIELQMPDGQSMGINVLGLAFYDSSSGNSVMLGQVQDSQGELVSSNVVLYPNAFNGVNADVRYTYRRGGFEQDVILRSQLPDPVAFGLNPETTKLEVMTEFLNPPQEKIVDHSKFKHPSQDESVSWGSMLLGHGKAFDLGDQKPFWDGTSVAKRYITTEDGRKVLLEMVPWKDVGVKTSHLPKQASLEHKKPVLMAGNPPLPGTPAPKSAQNPIKLASLPANKGFVLDYVLLNTATNNFTFQSDTTYLIYGGVSFSGTTIFEGGTCIKSSSSIGSQLQLYGPAVCKSSKYRPIVFTSQDDNSVGESIGSGTPSIALNEFSMDDGGGDVVMEHVRCSYCDVGVHPTCNTFRLTDAQFFNCYRPICPEYVNCQFNNVLIVNCTNVFWGGQYTVEASHFTVDGCQQFTAGWDDSSDDNITITNSLLVGIIGFGAAPVATNHTVQLSSDVGVFQSAGGGGYYLATNSPYRDSGTTNIDPGFLSDIATKTTYPPTIYYSPSNLTGTNWTLSPQVQRDSDVPDLGYHYDPLDYIFGTTLLINSTINVNPGTAVGVFGGTNGTYCGFWPADNGHFNSVGTPNSLNEIVEYSTVQEQAVPHWKLPTIGLIYYSSGTNFSINCRFTDFAVIAQDCSHIQDENSETPIGIRDCQFHGGSIESYYTSINLTNCLLERVYLDVEPGDSSSPSYRNNTFWNGTFIFVPWQNNAFIADNLFDRSAIPDYLGGVGISYSGGHNAYVTNCNTLDPIKGGDIILSNSPAYQSSWLGNYYFPPGSPLLNAGSTTADQVGLYHFTTQTNQVPETNSVVDIGYHYVATDAYGNPVVSNTNGIPDYVQYPNGFPPSILVQPTNRTAVLGDDVSFTVVAAGFPAPSYQWYFNGVAISGATNALLELDGVGTNNVGGYYVSVTNLYGSIASQTANLTNLTVNGNYVVVQNSVTNFIFQGDTTYYVDSQAKLYGTTTIEGGTVIKFGNHAATQIVLEGLLNCLTSPYRPALLTSRDDNSAGASIHQSSGVPTNCFQAFYLVDGGVQTNSYHNLRIKYAGTGIIGLNSVNVWDSQFITCGTAVSNAVGGFVGLHNVLVAMTTNCVATTGTVVGEFLTIDQSQNICPIAYAGAFLTNCILTAVANTNGAYLASSICLANGTGVYQTAGGGGYYLAAHAYQQIGTSNVNSGALSDIAGKTTWPPIVYNIPGNYFSTNLNLVPQAFRDASLTPDLGYHYDPLDYIMGSMYVTNASIVVNSGTAIGIYSTNRVYYGIAIANNATFLVTGLANQLAHIVEYNTVQELNPPGWQMPSDGNISQFGGTNYQINCRFTDWSCMAQDAPHIWCDGYIPNSWPMVFQECQFHGGTVVTWFQSLFFTNCLFERVNCDFEPGDQFIPAFCNNTVFGGTFGYSPWAATNALVCNNLFDRASIPDELAGWGWPWYAGSHNAYVTNYQTLDPVSPTDLILTTPPTYQNSWFGSYYLSPASPLVNAGNTTADQVGLYHFTTQTNQVPETNSIVDIGFHYVATDQYGNPLDANGDGTPDYLEDANGNGVWDPGELPFGITVETPANGTTIY